MADKATGKTIEIRTVEDFFKIPANRRDLCLAEFLMWMMMCELGDATGMLKSVRDVFKWIDDDKGRAHVHIKAGGGDDAK